MKFRPCIDIHNGKSKTDRRRQLKKMKAIWHRPILLQNRMQPGMQKKYKQDGLKRRAYHSAQFQRFRIF